ncbi:MAG: DUF3488 and DUF4129 domain-containing transglutaminase family protein [Mariniblastus sp.]
MLDVRRYLQITLYLVVLISSLLLGMSLESSRLVTIAVVGATIGFIVTDLFKLFRIEGVLANIASIVILVLAMKDFFPENSVGKLVSVANLLVYLQTILMFQKKTPRLNWQILVLSLLQVVVGAIFSLNFEAGLLFLLYFFVVGAAMVLQSVYADAVDVEQQNVNAAKRIEGTRNQGSANEEETKTLVAMSQVSTPSTPLTFFDQDVTSKSNVRSMATYMLFWLGMATIFTSVMFYLIPRHSKPWFGPNNVEVTSTGVSKSVNLDERGQITQSGRLIFRVEMFKPGEDEIHQFESEPYFRGLALSSLVIEDGKTNWRAPHDRVVDSVYQPLDVSEIASIPKAEKLFQKITLEETADPLVYGLMPFLRNENTPPELLFCHEVSALTRCRNREKIGMAPYPYIATTVLAADGSFSKTWPYLSNTLASQRVPMSKDPPQHAWLTSMDSERYPTIVGMSNQIAKEAADVPRMELLKKYEQYFLQEGRFKYTMDFRNVDRDDSIDPVEDFVRNHRSGHCELFASALTLMLRQQGIPARLVVGFYGAEFNDLSKVYMVREKHAHAWVEAYLRPEDCTPDMIERGQANEHGAWMTLDATPYSANEAATVGEDAIDLARTVWDDYVLGMDNEPVTGPVNSPLFKLLQGMNIENWESNIQKATRFTQDAAFKYTIGGFVAFILLLWWIRTVRSRPGGGPKISPKVGRLRRLFASAISLISPGLGQWVIDSANVDRPTAFYQRMLELLAKRDLARNPSQTHREFAQQVSTHFVEHPSANLIQSTVREITEIFNEVRFGEVDLDRDLTEQIDLSLAELESALSVETPAV